LAARNFSCSALDSSGESGLTFRAGVALAPCLAFLRAGNAIARLALAAFVL
jgi:hypothetical protein